MWNARDRGDNSAKIEREIYFLVRCVFLVVYFFHALALILR